MHNVLYCAPGCEPEAITIQGNITAKIQDLVGPTRSVEGVRIPGGYILYHDAEYASKKLPLNKVLLGTLIYGPFFIAKLDANSNPPVVGLKEAEIVALKELLLPPRITKKVIKNYSIN